MVESTLIVCEDLSSSPMYAICMVFKWCILCCIFECETW